MPFLLLCFTTFFFKNNNQEVKTSFQETYYHTEGFMIISVSLYVIQSLVSNQPDGVSGSGHLHPLDVVFGFLLDEVDSF